MAVRIFRAAHERIIEIWEYTEQQWGEEQADLYVTELFDELHRIAGAPHRWRPIREPGFEDVHFARYRHHFLFFRRLSDGDLGLISVLHEQMDVPTRLREDCGEH